MRGHRHVFLDERAKLGVLSSQRDQLEQGVSALELFNRAGLAMSNSEARRLIRGGGARINDVVVDSETKQVSVADLDANGILKLSAGRKRHALVRPV